MTAIKKAVAPSPEHDSPSQITPTKRSRKAAIEQHCSDCLYDPYSSGTWREQVAACTAKTCALYPFRPTPTRNPSLNRIALKNLELSDFQCNTGGE